MRHIFIAIALAVSASNAQSGSESSLVAKNIRALDSDKKATRLQAATTLGKQGKGARSAAPALKALLEREQDPQVALQAVQALTQIGAHAELQALLHHPGQHVRLQAAWGLAVIGPPAKKAVPDLLRLLANDEPMMRSLAAQALGEIGLDSEDDTRALIKLLADPQADVRQHAVFALMNIGARSVPALEKVLAEEEPVWVRTASLQALANQGRAARPVVPTLIRLLKDRDPDIRAQSAGTLAAIGPDAKQALPTLLDNLLDDNVKVQMIAFQATVAVGQDDRRVLLDGLRSANAKGRWATPFVLGTGLSGKQAVPGLIKNLADKDVGTRVAAALALGRIGKDAEPAIPALLAARKDVNKQVHAAAQQALAQIDQNNREAYIQKLRADQTTWLQEAKAQQTKFAAAQAQILRDTQLQLIKLQQPLLKLQLKQSQNLQDQVKYQQQLDNLLKNGPARPSDVKLSIAVQNKPMQAYVRQLVQMHIAYSSMPGDNPAGDWVRDQLSTMGTEAVPAFVDGLNLEVAYNMGFV